MIYLIQQETKKDVILRHEENEHKHSDKISQESDENSNDKK